MGYYDNTSSVVGTCNAVIPEIDYGHFSCTNPGQDLSGSLQGAGGIGGLLSWQTGTNCYFYVADANGNISELVNSRNPTNVLARYSYDPYGNILSSSGTLATSNTWRYSSKYWDVETGLGYWGYRYYDPRTGRWVGRDPAQESGGINLYGYCGNDGVGSVDRLGMSQGFDGSQFQSNEPLEPPISAGMLVGPDGYNGGNVEAFWFDSDETRRKRNAWLAKFKDMYKEKIDTAAKANCVPKKILEAIIGNERMFQSMFKAKAESIAIPSDSYSKIGQLFGRASSFGVASLPISAMVSEEYGNISKYHLSDFTDDKYYAWATTARPTTARYKMLDAVKKELLDPDRNIDMAAKYLRKILDTFCQKKRPTDFSEAWLKTTRLLLPEYNALCCSSCDKRVEMKPSATGLYLAGMLWQRGTLSFMGKEGPTKADDANGSNVSRWADAVNKW